MSHEPVGSAPPVGRLAPSPTGQLHLGHARSFLLAWWSIRSRAGRLLMRMEDLDTSRVRPGLADGMLRDLEWLGLDWDGPVTYQSERTDLYRAAVTTLESKGLLYPCTCTRREIQQAQSAPHADDAPRPYPGTCRDPAQRDPARTPALRFRVPPGPTPITDLLHGPLTFDVATETGDFPIWTRDDIPAYQLAVVVDDAAQAITEVLRGDDLLSSTARQQLLQRALDLPSPTWIHAPLVVTPDGRRLASRSADLPLADLREAGVDPRAIVAWAAASCGMHPEPLASPADLLPTFRLGAIPLTAVHLPPNILAHLGSPTT
ncbi:MAG: glutamyl-tRNA synthetase [Chlamydiales bacterium]